MHSRHRSPGGGGGMRSNNSMGMGGLAASRGISPETSSLPRSFSYNRSFGGGGGQRMPPPPKPYPNPQPLPPRRADILMEAGRLATEYLVSQGVLPPNVMAEKWGNGDGRPSALARVGNGDGGLGFRNRMRGRRRMGPGPAMRDYDYEWTRENRRNGFAPERARVSPDMEFEDDFGYGQSRREERQGEKDVTGAGVLKTIDNELTLKADVAGESESGVHCYGVPDEAGPKASTSTTGKGLPSETEGEASNVSDEMKISNMETDEAKDCSSIDGLEKQSVLEDISVHDIPVEGDINSKNGNNLLRLCDFAKVPTRARSSLTIKGSKVEMVPSETACDTSTQELPKVLNEEDPSESFSNILPNQTQSPVSLDSDISIAPSIQTVEDVGLLGSGLALQKGECGTSQSLLEISVVHEQTSGQGLSELGRCNSTVKEKGDKRPLQDDDCREGSKKPRECPSTEVDDDFFHLHNFSANSLHSNKSIAADVEVVEIEDQESLFDVSLLPRCALDSGIESKEEMQLFPGSFKICDLNLMESSELTESRDNKPVYGVPSTMEAENEVQVDVDLSMSNSCNSSDAYDRSAADVKRAVVVDLEDDSAKEDEDFDTSQRKTETAHSSLESFPNHVDSTGDLPDKDGYGLMISELLGNDIPNCSSAPADITSLHAEMGLHNAVEILDDDDPIYLTLGEIPISFLGWENPPQPFEKPF